MKNFWKNLKRKWRDWNFNRRIENGDLKMTPKGIKFYEYVKRIALNELLPEDKIGPYEEDFEALGEIMKCYLDDTGYTQEELRRIFSVAYTLKFAAAYDKAKEDLNGEFD